MKKLLFLLCLAVPVATIAQPLTRSFPFTMLSRDTGQAADFPQTSTGIAGAKGRITVSEDGHFTTADGQRIRFFGTELNYGANFLPGVDARDLARRFKKLGINAVRLSYLDHSSYAGASLIQYDPANSFKIDSLSFRRLDTLINELSNAGIYTLLTLQNVHYHWAGDGVAWWPDSLAYPNYMLHFYMDERAALLQREWAKTVLRHVNHLSKKRYADDPAIAAVEINGNGINGGYNFPLTAAWRYDWLNARGPGSNTLTYHRSRKLDTLYTEYLLRKYGTQTGINNAWRGPVLTNPPNLLENGSFEQTTSAAWSFAAANGSSGAPALLSPAKDSDFCIWVAVANLGSSPAAGDMYYLNLSTRCGKDTLYELKFWAKVRYSAQRPYTSRTVYTVVSPFGGGPGALAEYVTIDTTWRQFSFLFRGTTSGLQYLIFYLGHQMGDAMFDGVSIKQVQETGLFPGENTAARMITRTPYTRVAQVSYQRARDISLFYDSLQRVFYQKMIKTIRDDVKSQVLINAFPSWYWSSAMEPYANTLSDFTQCYINTDYMQARPNITYSDSTWRISNNTPLRDAGSYALGLVASQSLENKPMIINWLNPTMNQQNASMLPFVTGYASLQDWDGLFFGQYATYRDGLFVDQMFPAVGGYSTFYDIAGNPSIIGQFPAMSELFRTARFKPADSYVAVAHTKDDMELLPTIADYRHPFNVEGYLSPNIITNFKVRQRYNAAKHKVAAEYPYIADTSAKISDTQELYWSQSSGHFVGRSKTAALLGGTFGDDTLQLGTFIFRRTDKLLDQIAVAMFSMDTMPLGTSQFTHLTVAGRGQNTNMVWVDSFGFGKNWGTGPTLMSAPVLEFSLRSTHDFVYFHALDEKGARKRKYVVPLIDTALGLFKFELDLRDTKTMWYTIEQADDPAGVRKEAASADRVEVAVYPNPAASASTVALDLPMAAHVRMALYDALGREVVNIIDAPLTEGRYSLDLDVTALPAGRYLLVAGLGSEKIVRSIGVVK